MKLLVFGKTGQVAQALQRQAGPDLTIVTLGREEADLSQPAACAAHILNTDADAVINAAAYTAVDRAEDEEDLATQINGVAPGVMAKTAAARALPFLHISTDYVFDGTGHAPRQPDAACAPLNAYGRSKLAGERAVRASGAQHVILRTSWVFSADGANFVKTMLRLSEARDALTVVEDQIGGPTPADDIAATLVTMARAMIAGHAGGTYHYAGTPVTNWAGFARETFARSKRDVTVTGIPTSAYPTPAPRPLNSRLDCTATETDFGISTPDWRAGLATVITHLKQSIL